MPVLEGRESEGEQPPSARPEKRRGKFSSLPSPSLTDDPADDLRPGWSPFGTKIVFRSLRTNQGDVYLMKADGSKHEQLTDDPAQDAYPDWQPLPSGTTEPDD